MKAVLASLALTIAVVVPSAAKSKEWYVGYGDATCGDWIKARAAVANEQYPAAYEADVSAAWVQGFKNVLYFGVGKSGINHSVEPNAMEAWMDNHCKAHPLDRLVRAALDLDLDLERRDRGLPEKG